MERSLPSEPASPGDHGSKRFVCPPALIATVIAVVTMVVFWRLTGYDFVKYDDDDYFAANPRVQSGLSLDNLKWAFTTSHAGNWHPLTWISLMVDVEMFGTGPTGPHFSNLLLHTANAVLLFFLLRLLTGKDWCSAMVAALFAWHPLHVESVAWVSERKDVLSAFFGLLSLIAYVSGAKGQESGESRDAASRITRHAPRWYWLSVVCLALGLLSKPMLVTLPFVMLLLDWWLLNRVPGAECQVSGFPSQTLARLVWEKLPFFALIVASCVVTYWVQNRGGAVHSFESLALWPRLENAFVAYARYLFKAVWPVGLAIHYPHPVHWPWLKLAIGLAVVLGGSCLAIMWARRKPWLFTGWFWFLGMLVPVIGLVQVGTQSMADRYSYLPLIGIFIAAVWMVADWIERWPKARVPGAVAAAMILVACLGLTHRQLPVWRNSETLFLHASRVTRGNDLAHYNLGAHYFSQNRLDDAAAEYRQALAIKPTHIDALINLGVALVTKGDVESGVASLREAVRLRPDFPDAHYNLGNALVRQREFAEARRCYEETLRLAPERAEAHNNLANLLAMQGERERAAHHYGEVLRLNPNHAEARRHLEVLNAPVR